jgi:hypothetical protein
MQHDVGLAGCPRLKRRLCLIPARLRASFGGLERLFPGHAVAEDLEVAPTFAQSHRVAGCPGGQPLASVDHSGFPAPALARFLKCFFVCHLLLPINGV